MKFFAKKSSKKSSSVDDIDDQHNGNNEAADLPPSLHDPPSSPLGPPLPAKSSATPSASRSPSKRSILRPESPSSRGEAKPPSSRPSRSFRQATDSASRKKKIDPDTHPLNLPPEQRKRLSALSAMSDRTSMDVDKEPVNGATPSSPSPQAPPPQKQQQQQPKPAAPAHSNSFTVPVANGADASTNGADAGEKVPQPPPHRSQPASPVQTPAEEAEGYKNEGNKYFKLKDYGRAVDFYTKGMWQFCNLPSPLLPRSEC